MSHKDYVPADEANPFVAFCGKIAPFSSILLLLSPIPTIRQILRNGTVGDLPLLPYTFMVSSCFVWIVYGVLKGQPLIWGTNVVEFVLSVYYFVEFTNYAPNQSPTFPGSVMVHIRVIVGILAISLFVVLFFNDAIHTIGNLTVVLTCITFASPLAAVKTVVESQSSEAIPWPFTLATFGNCLLWGVVGIFEMHDVYVSMPEVLGIVFAMIQIALKLYYGDRTASGDSSNPSFTRTPVEMPYPVLDKVRQVVMFGSGNAATIQPLYGQLEQYDLQLNEGGSNTDYVELGMPLTDQASDPLQQPPAFARGSPTHHKHSHSDDGLESIAFDGPLQPSPLPHPEPLHGSFRARSASHNGPGPGGHH